MTAWRRIGAGALAGMLAPVSPAHADVTAQTEQGFVSRNVVVIAGSPAAVRKRLVTPSAWWSSEHTFSGDAANMTLDPVVGGCFCETLPADPADTPKPARPARPGAAAHPPARGGTQHMRVVFVDRAKALRMVGGLGPLQSEAVNATLTVTLKEVDGGTRVIFEYVVGGYMRYPPEKIAPAVDAVLGNQLLGLARQFGDVAAAHEESASPVPVSSGGGLGKKGLLLPRGRIWSLPSGPAAEPAGAALPALPRQPAPTAPAETAPLPTAPVQDDLAPAGGTTPAKHRITHQRANTKPDPQPGPAAPETPPTATPNTTTPDAAVKPLPEPLQPPKPAAKSPATPNKIRKPASKPAPPSDEPTKDSVNSAFDAAFGGAPRPAPEAQ